jgi:hypothetical protein
MKKLKAHYTDQKTMKLCKVEISQDDFNMVMKLRKMNKTQLKKLFEYIGCKQMMKISLISTNVVLEAFESDWQNFKVII